MKTRKKFDAYCRMITFQPITLLTLFMLTFLMACGIVNKKKRPQTKFPPDFEEKIFLIEKQNTTGVDDTTSIWYDTEVATMAEFKGGKEAMFEFIKENLRYPNEAIIKKLEGRVDVQFVIWTDGSVRNIEILNPQKKLEVLENEAMRVVRLMSTQQMWVPATQKGKNVPVRFRLPIEFQL